MIVDVRKKCPTSIMPGAVFDARAIRLRGPVLGDFHVPRRDRIKWGTVCPTSAHFPNPSQGYQKAEIARFMGFKRLRGETARLQIVLAAHCLNATSA